MSEGEWTRRFYLGISTSWHRARRVFTLQIGRRDIYSTMIRLDWIHGLAIGFNVLFLLNFMNCELFLNTWMYIPVCRTYAGTALSYCFWTSSTEEHFKSHKQPHSTVAIINSIFSMHCLMLYKICISIRVSEMFS